MDSQKITKRESTIDIAKGVLIVCVVAGHIAGWPANSSHIFYYFHLQTFFFISGYLFNYEKYKSKPTLLLRSRVSLYTKYFLYVLAFVALHNVLTNYGLNGYNAQDYVAYEYGLALSRSLLVPSEPMAGAMWFIPALLIMQGIVYVIMEVQRKTFTGESFSAFAVTFLFLAGFYCLHVKFYTPLDYRYLTFLPFFYAGIMVRKIKLPKAPAVPMLLLSFLFLFYAVRTGVNMHDYYDINPFELLSVSLFGVIFCMSLSRIISKTELSKPLEWAGERTIHILALHFLGFKVASLVLAEAGAVGRDQIYSLAGGIEGHPLLAPVYLIFGVALPVVVVMTYDIFKNRISRYSGHKRRI